jgi:tetratricopeptide (TPR) repeat protein
MVQTNFDLEEKFLTADRLISENRLSEAAKTLEEILAEAPDFGKAHNHLGWLYETKFKNLQRAEEHYRLALKFSPDYIHRFVNSMIWRNCWEMLLKFQASAMLPFIMNMVYCAKCRVSLMMRFITLNFIFRIPLMPKVSKPQPNPLNVANEKNN